MNMERGEEYYPEADAGPQGNTEKEEMEEEEEKEEEGEREKEGEGRTEVHAEETEREMRSEQGTKEEHAEKENEKAVPSGSGPGAPGRDISGKEGFFNYVNYIGPYVLLITLVFFAAAFAGYAYSASVPEISEMVMEEFEAQFGGILSLHPFLIMLIIFLNNAFVSLLFLVMGLGLGILPILFVAFNGYVVGVLSHLVAQERGILFILLALVPHGIIELPMVFLAAGIGLRLGHQVLAALLGRPTEIKKEFKDGIRFYFHWIVPLLFVAAVIETFITPLLLSII